MVLVDPAKPHVRFDSKRRVIHHPRMRTYPMTIALLLLASLPAAASGLVGKVVHVQDGDTFTISTAPEGRLVKVRFCGIDTPERGHQGYGEAKSALSRLSYRQQVRCVQVGQGTPCDGRSKPFSRDRTVAQCFLGDKDIAAEQVRAGHACDWSKFSSGHYRVNAQTCVR